MNACIRCRSYAINLNGHGREEGVDLDLCDVCYWRKRAEELAKLVDGENGLENKRRGQHA